MTTYLSVTPGIDMSRALGEGRLTKKWLREYLRDNPQKDFRNHTGPGAYVNGEDCINYDLSLEVYDRNSRLIAVVEFQRVERKPAPTNQPFTVGAMLGIEPEDTRTGAEVWGYQAVVR